MLTVCFLFGYNVPFGHLVLFIIYSVAFAPIVVIQKKSPCLLIDIGTNNYRGSTLLRCVHRQLRCRTPKCLSKVPCFWLPLSQIRLTEGSFYFSFLRTYLTSIIIRCLREVVKFFRKTSACLCLFFFLLSWRNF